MVATDDDIGSIDVPAEQVEVEPWFAVWVDGGVWPGQRERHAEVVERTGAVLGDRVYLAHGAAIVCESLRIGDRSYVAACCVLRDRIEMGDDCSINPYVTIAGRVVIGDGVRIASHAALFGANHRFSDVDTPIWAQGMEELGIVVGDDVWIGTHAVICDGVTVGDHSVVAAGAVVTADVPPWSVVGGVPARVLSDRRAGTVGAPPAMTTAEPSVAGGARRRRDDLSRFDDAVGEQWPTVLEQLSDPGKEPGGYRDVAGASPTVRATCDAIEIAAAFGEVGRAGDSAALVSWLQGLQDPITGLFPEPSEERPGDPLQWSVDAEFHHYGVLSVGYALELLGSSPVHPVRVVEDLAADDLVRRLAELPWSTLAWPAGAWVDFVGTAQYLNRRHHGSTRGPETLFGWLHTRADPFSGMWGQPDPTWGWLMPVNGFYRLTRGTYAQFDVPVPHPQETIDTVAGHARRNGWFRGAGREACNALDVVHPLWLCARRTDHRRAEMRDAAADMLIDSITHWHDGRGFAFAAGDAPGLQGTEMWLSIIHLLADLLGESDGLSFRPRGVHRLAAAETLRTLP